MLIITRRFGESFMIGDTVKVTIMHGGHGNQVRIGIEAPREVAVYRQEVYESIHAEKAAVGK